MKWAQNGDRRWDSEIIEGLQASVYWGRGDWAYDVYDPHGRQGNRPVGGYETVEAARDVAERALRGDATDREKNARFDIKERLDRYVGVELRAIPRQGQQDDYLNVSFHAVEHSSAGQFGGYFLDIELCGVLDSEPILFRYTQWGRRWETFEEAREAAGERGDAFAGWQVQRQLALIPDTTH